MSERWILGRGRGEPCVYPFASEQQALDFALDHGMTDWRAERSDDPSEEHRPICASCGEPWACHHVRVEGHANAVIRAAANRCAHCGKQIGWLRVRFRGVGPLGDDVSYHGKLGACFNAAKRRAAETADAAALKDIERCEENREYGRKLRAAAKERRAA